MKSINIYGNEVATGCNNSTLAIMWQPLLIFFSDLVAKHRESDFKSVLKFEGNTKYYNIPL